MYDKLLNSKNFFLIAGPCVVEDESLMMHTAETLKKTCDDRDITLIFKASYLKANRTSVTSFSGPGLQDGLKLLDKIKHEFQLPILTDVHESNEIEAVSQVADIIQIPAFLSRQTILIREAAKSGKIINIKKGQFMAPENMKAATEKVTAENNYKILVTERGTMFGYQNLIVDFRSFASLHSLRFPVIFDVTHSLQKPSINQISGGSPEYAPMMAKAALATGYVNGLFIETHPAPMDALSDSASMIQLETLPGLLDQCLRIKP